MQVLVIDGAQTQAVKQAVDVLGEEKHSQAHEQARHFRPWGWFETLISSHSYEVRRVHLYPNKKLSLQTHQKRSENRVVTSGSAEVRIEDKLFELSKISLPIFRQEQHTSWRTQNRCTTDSDRGENGRLSGRG